jgi:mRNA-binding protein PUF3
MTDVFGNYVIQKLFEHGNQSQKKILANNMRGHVLALSTQMYGCRVVQKALEHVLTDQQAVMVKELDGPNKQVLKVIKDQNGNHVVQKAIERIPAEHIHFIIEAHRGEVVKLATHTYGCRVIQRILEHCEPAAKRVILDELHGCVAPLITDSFGNYVVQHVIQNGEPDDRRRVVSIVQQQLLIFSKHKFASNVVEKCITYADSDQRAEIVRKLVGHNEQGQSPVLGLLRDQYGNYVIRESRILPFSSQLTSDAERIHSVITGAELEALTNEMKLSFPQLKRTSYGKQVLAIEKLLCGMNCSPASSSSPVSVGPSQQHQDYQVSTPTFISPPGQGQGHLHGHPSIILTEQH